MSIPVIGLFLFSFYSAQAVAQEEATSWDKLKAELSLHKQVIYVERPMTVVPGGFVVTDEIGHQSMQVPSIRDAEPADILVGFGTTANWSLAYARRAETLMFVDVSLDVVLAHIGLFRPLFLISQTPEEFIARAASVEFAPGDDIGTIYQKILKREFSERVFVDTRRKLAVQVATNKLTLAAAEFCLNALIAQHPEHASKVTFDGKVHEISSFPFKAASNAALFPQLLVEMHHQPTVIAQMQQHEMTVEANFAENFKQFDIFSPDGYRYLRHLYVSNQVYLAVGSLYEAETWQWLGGFANARRQRITDIYVSKLVQADEKNVSERVLLSNAALATKQFNWYSVNGVLPSTYEFKTHMGTVVQHANCYSVFSPGLIADELTRRFSSH